MTGTTDAAAPVPTATATEAFLGVPDGEIYPIEINPGDTLKGELARTAVEGGMAKPGSGFARKAPADKSGKTPETK